MKKVICFGTFDLFHLGHLNYFKQAKSYGDHLTVVIARDKNIKKAIIFSESERLELIKNVALVDEVVLGNEDDQYKIIEQKNSEVICLGYDHSIKEEELRAELEKRGLNLEIKRMKSYKHEKHKSSLLKNTILQTLS